MVYFTVAGPSDGGGLVYTCHIPSDLYFSATWVAFLDECCDGLLVQLMITMLLPLCVDLLPIIGSGWAV